ncbi:unnamed protein product [Urochloa humidicola]
MKYWDEETAFRRDIYDINNGRAHGTLVDDLKKAPTSDKPNNEATEKGMTTPKSMIDQFSKAFKKVNNRVTSLEKKFRIMNENNQSSARRCLEDDFDDNANTSESETMVPSDEDLNCSDEHTSNSIDGMSVAATVKQNKRKRQTPKKYKSPTIPMKAGRRSALKTAEQRSNKKAQNSAVKEDSTPQQNAVVNYVNTNYLANKNFRTETLFRHNRFGVPANELICLTLPTGIQDGDKSLTSAVIDAYTQHILQPRLGESKIICPALYSWVASDYESGRYENPVSAQFIQDVAKTLFSAEKVFMPFHIKRTELTQHWIVVVLMNRKGEIQILDSLGWELESYAPQLNKLNHGLASLAKIVPMGPQSVGEWEIVQKKNLPKQEDGCSCGLYSIKFMELWNGSRLTKKFAQADIGRIRKEVVAEIILADANQADNVKAGVQEMMK